MNVLRYSSQILHKWVCILTEANSMMNTHLKRARAIDRNLFAKSRKGKFSRRSIDNCP
jgi:hypothetical protein